jgi:formimidoylglutamate deiminase
MQALHCDCALLHIGWARDVRIEIDEAGDIVGIQVGAAPGDAVRAAGPVIPGMPNLHSHAFQRAMAGLAERRGAGPDSFWTWRRVMYDFLARLTPEQMGAIAAQLYVEMLKSGYTAVAEFHYLHHQPDGQPYADRSEMCGRVVEAAMTAGVGITHLPTLYMQGGFGGVAPAPEQGRFLNDVDDLLGIVDELLFRYEKEVNVRVGVALHSLRAVAPGALAQLAAGVSARDDAAPIHIHVAEQTREVEECIAALGSRPVEWLLDNADIDGRWCLVHATHLTDDERARLAASGAIAGLCPTTEANLGDGIFPAVEYLSAGGVFGVGSDSHVSVSPVEELRWLEYSQRLVHRRRALLADEGGSVGARLYGGALAGGAAACGRPIGALAPGHRADLVVLDGDHPALLGGEGDRLLDALIFSGNTSPVRDVMVGGRWVVQEGRHEAEEDVLKVYRAAARELAS